MLSTYCPIWRPHVFDRVTVMGRREGERTGPLFSIIGRVYSQYDSGPSVLELADYAGRLLGAGAYGLESARYLGWRAE